MPLDLTATGVATAIDVVGVEEADALREWCHGVTSPAVDLSACTHLHAANLQVLLAARARIRAWPEDARLAAWLRHAFPDS